MTAIAVFSGNGGSTIHLVADTLRSLSINSRTAKATPTRLSTGLLLDDGDQTNVAFSEGALKLGIIQSNIAIGYAGNAEAANGALRLLKEYAPFVNLSDFQQFLTECVIPSITPCEGGIELCGFMSDQVGTKFRYNAHTGFESTQDPSATFVCGTGGRLFSSLLSRSLRGEELLDPDTEFRHIALDFYTNEFLGNKTNIRSHYSGGAISGLYGENGRVSWHKSGTVIIFANIGGTGTDARFKRLPIVHKTWYEQDNLFSSSCIEDDIGYVQNIVQYSNSTSGPIAWNKSCLLPDMLTFDADVLTSILLPRGINSYLYAAITFIKRDNNENMNFFEEDVEQGRLRHFRVDPITLQQINDSVFIQDDYTVDLSLYNTDDWEVIGIAGFRPQACIIHFECGSERRKLFCVQKSLYQRHEPPEFPAPMDYLWMKGVLLPESGQLPPNPTIRAIHIPVIYITQIELGPYFRFHDPGEVPTLLVMPDFSASPYAMALDEVREALKELPEGIQTE